MRFKEKRIQSQICEALKKRRIALQLSQKAASEKSTVSFATLQKFENTGKISLQSLIKLMITYKMDNKILNALNDRSDWTIEQIERAEKKKKIRPKTKTKTNVWIVPIDDAEFGVFTKDKKYEALYDEGTFTDKIGIKKRTGRSFVIKDDTGKELLITEDYCKKIIENE